MSGFYIGTKCLMLPLILTGVHLSAQKMVSGTIKDAETRHFIGFCNIVVVQTTLGTTSSNAGKFNIQVPNNNMDCKLIISALGYLTDTVQVGLLKGNGEILLKPTQGALDNVVVAGVSKATLVRQNPAAVVNVSAKAIEQATETNIIDVLVKNVPGLNAVKTGPNISKPFIRGLGYNRVLTLYDGIRQEGQQWGDEHGIEVDAYNIEKAEVIKGPASIMYGSDAVAGVVSLMPAVNKNHDGKLHGKYFSEYQHNNGLIGTGIRLFYADNRWTYSLNGSYRIAKNYTNNVDGQVYNTGFNETNISSGIQHLNDRGTFNLNFTLYDNLQGIPDGSRDSLTRQFTKQIDEGKKDDVKTRPIVYGAELNKYQSSPLHQHIQHYRIYSNNHYLIANGDIYFNLAFQQNIRREYNHPTIPGQAGMFVRLNTFNYGFRYNAPTILNTEISIGLNGMYQNNKSKNGTDFPIPDYYLFDAGGYLFAKWKQKKWTIGSGVRYDTRLLKSNDFYTKTNPVTGFQIHTITDTSGAYLQFPTIDNTFNGVSLSVGATLQLNEHVNLKANVAKGYRSPSITEFAANGLDPGAHITYLGNRNFVPEFNLQEDIGADVYFKDFSASISVFNNNIQHYIYLSQLTDINNYPVIDVQGNKTYQYQQAAAQLYGIEGIVDLHPAILKGLSFNNSFSIIYGFNKKELYKNEKINGEYLPLIPPLKLLSSINQNIQLNTKLFKELDARLEAEINGAQNRFLALNETETATPAYHLFNCSINTKFKYAKENNFQIQLQVNNILDKAYQSNLSRLKYAEYYIVPANGYSGIYNMGRNVSLKVVVGF